MKTNGNGYHESSVLIVDDHPENVRLLCRILNSNGYDLRTVSRGVDAVKSAHGLKPDLILLDIQMPEMDGFEVCQHLKADDNTRDIPIIFISALQNTEDIVKGLQLGAADYVTKPFQLKEVLARVENQLTLARQRKEIEHLREQDRQHFESLNKMQNEFIQMATHDLKNPLNVILGYAHLLSVSIPVAPEHEAFYHDAIGAIQGGVEKMRLLVTDILDLSKVQTGVGFQARPVSVAQLLHKTLRGFELIAKNKLIELAIELPPATVHMLGDADSMERVIDNLVSNAVKYTPEGGQVRVCVEYDDESIMLYVSDTGLGIPAEAIPHLFDAFFRIRSNEHYQIEGTGLGLSIVKSIIDQHGGQIDVESEPNCGSVFSVKLPRCPSDCDSRQSAA